MKHAELFLTLSSSNFMSPVTPLNPMNLYHSKNVSVVNSTQPDNSVTKLANPKFMDFSFLTNVDLWLN